MRRASAARGWRGVANAHAGGMQAARADESRSPRLAVALATDLEAQRRRSGCTAGQCGSFSGYRPVGQVVLARGAGARSDWRGSLLKVVGAAVKQMDLTVGVFRVTRVMRDHTNRRPFVVESFE